MATSLGPAAVGLDRAMLILGFQVHRSGSGGRIMEGGLIVCPNRLVESLPQPARMARKHLELAAELQLDLCRLDLINGVSSRISKTLSLNMNLKFFFSKFGISIDKVYYRFASV